MGLETTANTYVRVQDGNFEVNVDASDMKALVRHSAEYGPTHYRTYKKLSGIIVDIRVRKNVKGNEFLNVTLEDKGQRYVLTLFIKSNEARCIFQTIENIALEFPVFLFPWRKEKKSGMRVQQAEPINWKYTKDNPQGMPDWEHSELGWDMSAQLNFFKAIITDKIHPLLGIEIKEEEAQEAAADDAPNLKDIDDLPF